MKTLRELSKDIRFSIALGMLLVLIGVTLISFFSPYDPTEWLIVARDMPPSFEHLLGTNSKGQDVFWRLTFSLRNSIIVGAVAGIISMAIAVIVGLVSGYLGRIIDRVLMFITDAFLVIPLLLIIILLAMLLKEQLGLMSMVLLFGLTVWPWSTRVIRSQILSLREREFTYTAVLSGTPARKLIFNEYFPFIIPLVLAQFINSMIAVVGLEITLAFIGLTDMSLPTLGSMLQWANSYQAMLLGLWWWMYPPIIVSVLLFVSLYLISKSISEYLDPRARMQRVGAR